MSRELSIHEAQSDASVIQKDRRVRATFRTEKQVTRRVLAVAADTFGEDYGTILYITTK